MSTSKRSPSNPSKAKQSKKKKTATQVKKRTQSPPSHKYIISTVQQKGGVGKTTLTVHLAHMIHALRPHWKIAVADADPQKSASNWITRGNELGQSMLQGYVVAQDGLGKQMNRELSEIEADVLFIDSPPAIESISLRSALYADLMLIPVGASILDIEAARQTIDVCEEAKAVDPRKKILLIPSKVRQNTSTSRELRPILQEWGEVSQSTIALRVAYADAATHGEGIHSYAPHSASYREMYRLANEVLSIIEESV